MLAVDLEPPALWVHRGAAPDMARSHRHDDLEVNAVLDGRLDYLFGGDAFSVHAGELALFWAATPHRLLAHDDDAAGDVGWLHVPLTTVVTWGLRDAELARLLRRRPITVPAREVHPDLGWAFERWRRELGGGRHPTALLEVQALVRRALGVDDGAPRGAAPDAGPGAVALMAGYAAEHFREAIGPSDVAAAGGVHPRHGMVLFRRTVGSTIGRYLAECRVAEAQRLLIDGSDGLLDIAHAAGFGSQSAFYETFGRIVGVTPGAYRRRFRATRVAEPDSAR